MRIEIVVRVWYIRIGNQTRGIFISSQNYPAYYGNTDFVTIATTGTCTDFGDNTNTRYGGAASAITKEQYSGGVVGATSPVLCITMRLSQLQVVGQTLVI